MPCPKGNRHTDLGLLLAADQNLKDVHKIVAAVRYGSLEIGDAVEHIVDLCRVSQQVLLLCCRICHLSCSAAVPVLGRIALVCVEDV